MTAPNPQPTAPAVPDDTATPAATVIAGMESALAELVRAWCRDDSATGRALVSELATLSSYIQRVRAEVAALSVAPVYDIFIPSATDQLDAIVEMTAAATHRIMDAAEALERAVAAGTPDAELRGAVAGATTTIYEACAFQDITGQRVRKVVGALQNIERRLAALLLAFTSGAEPQLGGGRPPSPAADTVPTAALEGPALPGAASSQADIDALFDRDPVR